MHAPHAFAHLSEIACLRLPTCRSDGDGEVIGAVQLINKINPNDKSRMAFNKMDLQLCKAISMQIGLAMMNIRHREQVEIYSDMLMKQTGS